MDLGIRDNDFLRIFNKLEEMSSIDDISDLWQEMLRRYDLNSVAYLGVGISPEDQKDPYLSVTYSSNWVEHYKQRGYVEHDPVVLQGFRQILPMEWDAFPRTDAIVKQIFGEAREFGLGTRGLTIPIRGRGTARALFSITSSVNSIEWRRMRLYLMRDFQILGFHAHELITRFKNATPKKELILSKREMECLYWASKGKTAYETSVILAISERTIKFYLENARRKLNSINNTQAVAKAIAMGLLRPGP